MMSSTNEEDPFLQVQQDVLAQLDQTRPLFTSYLRIRSLTTAADSPELAAARADLETALGSLADDLADLINAVRAIETDPAQYGLTAAELRRRQQLVQEVGGEVEDMRDELAKTLAQAQAQAGGSGSGAGSRSAAQKARDARRAANSDLPDPNAFALGGGTGAGDGDDDGDDDYAAEFEQQQQAHMMREQDEQLDGVFRTVGNIRRQADDMGRELEEQREMLEVVDTLTDRVSGRLQTGMAKLSVIARRNEDRWSSCCIAALIMVLIILLVLLLIL